MPYVKKEHYEKLLLAAELDDNFTRCEMCGAWMFLDDENAACVSDDDGNRYSGCWWSVTQRDKDKETCVMNQNGGSLNKQTSHYH